ncbi:unnamed protein product [Moneuplotes crassus]|uniref:Uncharacterized protein n=1 Tax=Euplotes crassus TaxID=5936 RepID=A0AAD1XC72_EUPCR|nr:unnamed protein product [Moneuplotes crassus]
MNYQPKLSGNTKNISTFRLPPKTFRGNRRSVHTSPSYYSQTPRLSDEDKQKCNLLLKEYVKLQRQNIKFADTKSQMLNQSLKASLIEKSERAKAEYKQLIRKYRMMYNNKPSRVRTRSIIQFKYKGDETIDMEDLRRRQRERKKRAEIRKGKCLSGQKSSLKNVFKKTPFSLNEDNKEQDKFVSIGKKGPVPIHSFKLNLKTDFRKETMPIINFKKTESTPLLEKNKLEASNTFLTNIGEDLSKKLSNEDKSNNSQKESTTKHHPHRYYNFPIRKKERNENSLMNDDLIQPKDIQNDLIPTEPTCLDIASVPVEEKPDAEKETTIHTSIYSANNLPKTAVQPKRKIEPLIYEVEYERCKVSKNRGYKEFIEDINKRQSERKNQRKIHFNKSTEPTGQYVQQYFVRQLGYSLPK